jgi:DNA polymerase sigma
VITGAKMQVDRTQDSNKDEAALSAVRSSIYRLARELQDRDGASRTRWITSLKVIPSAKVPLIKLTVENNIMIDMTFAVELTSHVHNGLQSAHLIRYYMQRLPELRPLTLVLKQFLFEKGLSQSYTGGLSSYCLVLLIVTFLQCMEQVQRNGERSKKPGAEHRTATRSPGFSVVRRKSVNVNIINGPMALQSCSHQSASIMISAKLKSNTEKPETRVPSSAPASPALSHVIASPPELDFMRTLDESSSEDSSVLCSDNNHLQAEDMQTRVEGRPNLGRLLIALLSFYGSFDFQKMGICPQLNAEQGGACYYRLPQPTTSLVISDPLDPLTSLDPMLAQNIGSGIFAMYRVKAAFHWASSILCASFSVPFRPDKRSAATVSLLSRVIDGPRAAPE